MAPQVLATFRVIFSGRERGKAFALYGAMAGFASAVGLVLGGVLTDANLFGWSWRAGFFVNVPVALVPLAAGLRLVPPTRGPAARPPGRPGGGGAGGGGAGGRPGGDRLSAAGGPPARLAGLDLAVDGGWRRRDSSARGAGGTWPPDAAGPGLPGRHGSAATAAAVRHPGVRRRVRR